MSPTHETQPLRDLVAGRIDGRWDAWAKRHSHLAAAIDRTQLVESTVRRLRDDPAFAKALRRAEIDADRLGEVAQVLAMVESAVGRVLKF